jgi:butyryl-CoA dehydrogenase
MQQMLVDSARRWCERECTPAARAQVSDHVDGCPPERWIGLAQLGWLGLTLPQDVNGLGAGLHEQCLLLEQLGRGLLVEPFVASAALGATLFDRMAQSELRDDWLAALASGQRRVVWAAWEPDGDTRLRQADAVAAEHGGVWMLSGAKGLMPGVGGASGWLVTAQLRGDPEQMGLFLLQAGADGVGVASARMYDGRHAGKLSFEGAAGMLLRRGPNREMLALLNGVLDQGRVAHCAETLGTAQAAFDITLNYVRARTQFGRALGANQVIQHRLVDLYVQIQEAWALCLQAASDASSRNVAALCLCTGQVARLTWEESLQLHGAIGMTEEYALGEYVRRLALAADLYGNGPAHAEDLASLYLEISP